MLAIGFGHDNVDRSLCSFCWMVTESGLVFQGGWLGNVAVGSTSSELRGDVGWQFCSGLSCCSLLASWVAILQWIELLCCIAASEIKKIVTL